MKRKSTRDLVVSASKRQEPISEMMDKPTISIKAARPEAPSVISHEDLVQTTPKKVRAKREKKERQVKQSPKAAPLIFRSKVFWGCASLLVAFLLAFVAMPLMENHRNSQMVSVIVAAQDIPEGIRIESSMLQQKQIRQVDMPSGALLAGDEAVGKYTSVTVLAGDMLTVAKVGNTYYEDAYLYDLPDGKMAMSIELSDLAQSVSGKIRSGDVIRIYAVLNNSAPAESSTVDSAALIDELQYVAVLAVTNYDIQDIQEKESGDTEHTKDSKSIATVTLLVNHQQAAVLAGLSENATLYAALVVRGDEAKKQAALEAEDRYLNAKSGSAGSEPTESVVEQ